MKNLQRHVMQSATGPSRPLLMTRIRWTDNASRGPWLERAVYTICSRFAICSFFGKGTGPFPSPLVPFGSEGGPLLERPVAGCALCLLPDNLTCVRFRTYPTLAHHR